MPTVTIRVKLPQDRTKTGTLELVDPLTGLVAFGPVPVLGRGARNIASQHGNPTGNSLKPFGDTPLGDYSIPAVLQSGGGTAHPAEMYGSVGVVVLNPISGPAATAKGNGRTGFLIHAGRQVASPTPLPSQLRPTNGCLRVLEPDLVGLINAMRTESMLFPVSAHLEVTTTPGPTGARDENVDDGDPPSLNGTPIIP